KRNEQKTIYSFEHQKISNELSNKLEKKVKLKILKSGKGKIEIPFNSIMTLDMVFYVLYLWTVRKTSNRTILEGFAF
ncbi:MAG TPA: hypothetical protein DCG18_00960, partial [Richelia sp.]|nr:hypothetical protein [Richelia sp.]